MKQEIDMYREEVNISDSLKTLKETVYPDASNDEVKMVYSYCKALGLDPMTKPVHLVSIPKRVNSQFVYQTCVMPSINLYRTIAHRSGSYAGKGEPEFGPEIQTQGIKHPEWCKVTVYRMLNGQKCGYTAKEYWSENVATSYDKKTSSKKINQMWSIRPKGQIAKCAEAQALRQAFGLEMLGLPTSEEIVGKYLFDREFGEKKSKKAEEILNKLDLKKEVVNEEYAQYTDTVSVKAPVTDKDCQEFVDVLTAEPTFKELLDIHNVSQDKRQEWLIKGGVDDLDDLKQETKDAVIKKLKAEKK